MKKMLAGSLVLLSLLFSGCHQTVDTAPTESPKKEKTASVTESGTAFRDNGNLVKDKGLPKEENASPSTESETTSTDENALAKDPSEEDNSYHYVINEVLPQCRGHLTDEEIDFGNDIIKAVHEGRKKLNAKKLDYEGVVRGWCAANMSNPIVSMTEIDTDNMKLIYDKKKKEHLSYVKAWEREVEKILNDNIKPSYNDLLKAAAIERYIAMSTKYNYEEYNSIEETGDSGDYETSALTVIMDHVGICNGYARAVAYLLNELKVPVYLIHILGHEWNMVQIDGVWYHIDATFDSGDDLTIDNYSWEHFGMSDKKRAETLEFMGYDYKKWRIPYSNAIEEAYKAPKCKRDLDTSKLTELLKH